MWKYVGMAEVPAFVRAAVGSATALLACRFFLPEPLTVLRIPISIIVVNTVLAFGGLLGLRVLRRALWEREVSRRRAAEGGVRHRPPVLLVGAGAAGVMAVREIRSRGEHDMEMRGFVDDDPGKQGAVICGIKVLGSTEELPTPRAGPRHRAGDRHDRFGLRRGDAPHPVDLRADPGAGADGAGSLRPAAGGGAGREPALTGLRAGYSMSRAGQPGGAAETAERAAAGRPSSGGRSALVAAATTHAT